MQAFKRVGIPAVKLLLIPGLTEAFFDGGLGVAFFNMPVGCHFVSTVYVTCCNRPSWAAGSLAVQHASLPARILSLALQSQAEIVALHSDRREMPMPVPMQVLFAFAMGFILKAVGPALVMQLMFELQTKRLGTERRESSAAARSHITTPPANIPPASRFRCC